MYSIKVMLYKVTAYCTLIRPTLEYTALISDPHQQYLIDEIERVQRRAARWVKADYGMTSSVTMMLNDFKWPTCIPAKASPP